MYIVCLRVFLIKADMCTYIYTGTAPRMSHLDIWAGYLGRCIPIYVQSVCQKTKRLNPCTSLDDAV